MLYALNIVQLCQLSFDKAEKTKTKDLELVDLSKADCPPRCGVGLIRVVRNLNRAKGEVREKSPSLPEGLITSLGRRDINHWGSEHGLWWLPSKVAPHDPCRLVFRPASGVVHVTPRLWRR